MIIFELFLSLISTLYLNHMFLILIKKENETLTKSDENLYDIIYVLYFLTMLIFFIIFKKDILFLILFQAIIITVSVLTTDRSNYNKKLKYSGKIMDWVVIFEMITVPVIQFTIIAVIIISVILLFFI